MTLKTYGIQNMTLKPHIQNVTLKTFKMWHLKQSKCDTRNSLNVTLKHTQNMTLKQSKCHSKTYSRYNTKNAHSKCGTKITQNVTLKKIFKIWH